MKWFRVATEGATTDGRTIARGWLEQIAKNFDPQRYGARIWMEHFRGLFPDGPFKAYGDVRAVKVQENDDGKLELYAQLDPTSDLVQMTKARQKIYTSIEVDPDLDRKSTRLNSSHVAISYAVFCLKKKIKSTNKSI